ncbi:MULTISPECIES: IS630 family transposase [unclassified Muribaculaceae]|uniref:IS630 family transposase n=1 Tax=Duncaniella muricolitica TaxID=2880704 RepID=UPI000F4A36E5|nr:IS630 family transposase [Muribaculaceae bacterium]ROT14479.1 IS630 family transposase [Muribaculaceae bacterium Isolate-110 (HZI)]RXE72018.1 IS630 family transposase [Muribaculaceae bacterium Isolate-013 (NCI)]
MRKTPKGTPSPQEYAYKKELLQELERQWESGFIDLYYGDESHVCTEGYVPYAWKFKDEDFCVPVYKCGRLNIFGMIDRNNTYHGFTTTENINSDKFIEFMEDFSLGISKETVVVLDNSSVHKSRKVKDCLQRWKDRGLHIFYLPPYSPHLNIAETLWRIMKGKWIQPHLYGDKHVLFATVEDILSNVGKRYMINFCRPAA